MTEAAPAPALALLVECCGDVLSEVGRRQFDPDAGMEFTSSMIGHLLAAIDALEPRLDLEIMKQARQRAGSTYLRTGEFVRRWKIGDPVNE